MSSPSSEFEFKIKTVKWFGLLSAVVIILMIMLGFWYLDKILDQSTAFTSKLDFQQKLIQPNPDPQLIRLGIEHDGLNMRNKRTVSALYMRAYSQFLAIIAGSVLALLGAVFVLARVDNVPTEGEAAFDKAKLLLKSASPGIVVTVVGALLIGGVVVVSGDPITATDRPIFQSFADMPGTTMDETGPGSLFAIEMEKDLELIRAREGADR